MPFVDAFFDNAPVTIVFIFDNDIFVHDDHLAILADQGFAGIERNTLWAAADNADALVIQRKQFLRQEFFLPPRFPFLKGNHGLAGHAIHTYLSRNIFQVLDHIAATHAARHVAEPGSDGLFGKVMMIDGAHSFLIIILINMWKLYRHGSEIFNRNSSDVAQKGKHLFLIYFLRLRISHPRGIP